MKPTKSLRLLSCFLLMSFSLFSHGQQPVPVGKGSYAEYPPLYKSKTNEHAGDQSRIMQTKELFIKEDGSPIPTNDWWTDVLNTRYSGNLWAYPQVVNAEEYGIFVAYPKSWSSDGCEMKWNTQLEISGYKFKPESAVAERWHDWGLEMKMAQGEKEMKVTLAHGIPFTWVETKDVTPQMNVKSAKCYIRGEEVTFPYVGNKMVVRFGEDAYGVYVPDNTRFESDGNILSIYYSGDRQFLSVAVLPREDDLDAYAAYAFTIPRSTDVTWNYDETSGKVTSNWKITTEDLNGKGNQQVLQGFIPHHYKRSELSFGFTNYEYATPRGKMKMAVGNIFSISYDFNGILPYYAVPKEMAEFKNPYQRARMIQMIEEYAAKGSFGGDTYWGGKGLTQMALYMTFAYELGEMELFERCKDRLKEVMANWLTYTPGENNFFFARYQRWGALVGYDTSYDSDTFNDHHFHYGYFTYAGALLALFDEDFRESYGDILTLVAKDYANWDKNDKAFPFFRTFDPWAGHSYAGGLAGWGGNGQESTSESMQGWGGVYLLGVATGNKAMRDAGIFGWVTESRGVAEYWFDRDRENINRELYTKPYNSNLTSQGIGWWTWFSGDPVWMHSIQWMPISPCLKYLSENLEFARWDYTQMWEKKEIGGWDHVSNGSSLGDESGLGNVVLSYLQRFDPDSAAAVFDKAWDGGKNLAKNPDTGGISYYILHSHRTYGEIDWDIHADLPTATTYKNKATGRYTYVVYNPNKSEQVVKFYRNGIVEKEFRAPGGKLTVYSDASYASGIRVDTKEGVIVAPGKSLQLQAKVVDQYGATVDEALSWSTGENGTVDKNGLFIAGNQKGKPCRVTIVLGDLSVFLDIMINDEPVLSEATLLPDQPYLEVGKSLNFSLAMKDQYGNDYASDVDWKILKDGKVIKTDSVLDAKEVGVYSIQATVHGKNYTKEIYLSPKMSNIALGKKVIVSSEENVGLLAKYATDGDKTTRWGSEHSDPQWIYVDLGETAFVASVGLAWEAAYASEYEVQVSDNAETWSTVKQVSGMGGTETIDINRTTRYVRMYGTGRGSAYGYSLYEFEVYGIPSSLNPSDILGLQIISPTILLKEDEPVQLKAIAYNGQGQQVSATISWTLDGKGEITANGLFTPHQYGKLKVEAAAGGKTSEETFIVEESLKLTSISLSPRSALIVTGDSQEFEVTAKDQFGVAYPATGLTYEVVGKGGAFSGNSFTASLPGEYKLIAGNGVMRDTVVIKVADIKEVNLALNKPVTASGSENDGLLPQYANDGNRETRWGSRFMNGEYIQSDLNDYFVLDRVKLFWQESYASSYRIEVSVDEDEWKTVYSNTVCKGGNEELSFDPIAARYVRIVCLTRNSVYGASLWEVEIYGTSKWQNPIPTEIVVSPRPLVCYIGENTQLTAEVFDQYGIVMKTDSPVVYQVNGGGTVDAENRFIPSQIGTFELTAQYKGLIGRFSLTVQPQKTLSNIKVTPSYYMLKVSEPLKLEVRGLDQYGNDYPITPEWSCSGGTISADGEFTASEAGAYTVTAKAGDKEGTMEMEVIEPDHTNLVLKKPVETSSALSGGDGAVDGNQGTRWESAHQDGPEWLRVDLKGYYWLTDIEIVWETASASDYVVQISNDGEHWNELSAVSGKTGARTDKFRVNGGGNYLRVYCTHRSTAWGYSIIEMSAYGKNMGTGEPYRINWVNSPATVVNVDDFVTYEAEVLDISGALVTKYPVTWSVNGGGTIDADGTYHVQTVGEYTLSVSCKQAQAYLDVKVEALTSIDSNTKQQTILIQEANSLVVLGNDIESVSLFDMQGRLLKTKVSCEEDKCRMDIGNIKGLYVLMVKLHAGYELFKIVM